MKDLYNVIEGILDDQEDIIDQAADDVIKAQKKMINDIVKHSLKNNYYGDTTYDVKKKVIKLYILTLKLYNGEVCIHLRPLRGTSRNSIYIPIKHVTDMGVKFDGSLCISSECIRAGFKLSQANIVGSGHMLQIEDPCMKMTDAQLDAFVDCSTKCFDLLLDHNSSIASFKSTHKFKVIKTAAPWPLEAQHSNKGAHHGMVGCKSDVLYIVNCANYCSSFNSKYKNFRTFAEILDLEAKGNPFDASYTDFCKQLIELNPGCKIIVDLYGSVSPTHIWLDNKGNVKYKELPPEEPWNKI